MGCKRSIMLVRSCKWCYLSYWGVGYRFVVGDGDGGDVVGDSCDDIGDDADGADGGCELFDDAGCFACIVPSVLFNLGRGHIRATCKGPH